MKRIKVDARLAASVAVAVLGLALYWAAVVAADRYYESPVATASTYSAAPEGLSVLYTYLEQAGASPAQLTSFDELPEEGTLVIAADARLEKPVTDSEAERVARWVRDGGRLILAGWHGEAVARALDLYAVPSGGTLAELPPRQPAGALVGVSRVEAGEQRLRAEDAGWAAPLADASGAAMLVRGVGGGEVVWLGTAYPLTNAGIASADNARFAVQLVTVGGPVTFDEYHHGFAYGGGVWTRIGDAGRAGVLLVALATVVALYALGRRIGPPIREISTPEARTTTYIASLAQLYRTAGARAEALEALEDGIARASATRHGSVAFGLTRHPSAARAIERSAALRERGSVTEEEFVSAAAALVAAKREVEGIDG
ncbi:MAG: DUF4350 domain-containing protein [Coriobacteriia bacterium]